MASMKYVICIWHCWNESDPAGSDCFLPSRAAVREYEKLCGPFDHVDLVKVPMSKAGICLALTHLPNR